MVYFRRFVPKAMTPQLFRVLRDSRAVGWDARNVGTSRERLTVTVANWEAVPVDVFRDTFLLFRDHRALMAHAALGSATEEQLGTLRREDLLPLLGHAQEAVRMQAMRVVAHVSP